MCRRRSRIDNVWHGMLHMLCIYIGVRNRISCDVCIPRPNTQHISWYIYCVLLLPLCGIDVISSKQSYYCFLKRFNVNLTQLVMLLKQSLACFSWYAGRSEPSNWVSIILAVIIARRYYEVYFIYIRWIHYSC